MEQANVGYSNICMSIFCISPYQKQWVSTLKVFLLSFSLGGFFSSLFSGLFGTREMRILILGLDGAGKTTILYRLQVGEVVTTIPSMYCFAQFLNQMLALMLITPPLISPICQMHCFEYSDVIRINLYSNFASKVWYWCLVVWYGIDQ